MTEDESLRDGADEQHVSTAELSGETVTDSPLQSVALLRKLISFKEINQIAGQRSDVQGLIQTAYHGGCILIAAVLTRMALLYKNDVNTNPALGFAALTACILLQGYFLSFLFMALHEVVHMTAFSSKWLNQTLGFIVGFGSVRPPVHYKLYHFAHHRFTGNKEKDPELFNTLLDPDIKTLGGYLFYLSSIPFWISRTSTVMRHAMGGIDKSEYFIATDQQKKEIQSEARLFCLLYAIVAVVFVMFSSNAALVYWLIPTIVGQPFLRFYLLAEHTGCQLGNNMMANTRTTVTWLFYSRLAWNMPYHSEHHAWPSVPFHKLPKVYKLINGVSVNNSGCNPDGKNGYFGVHEGFLKQIISPKKAD